MVGFQTRMTWSCQKELIRAMPGMANASILRYGTIHRNIFLNIPELCSPYLEDRRRPGLFYAGQICGVEGYVESIMSAIIVALAVVAHSEGRSLPPLPEATMIGALMEYVHTPSRNYQPMNANMGIMPFEGLRRRAKRRERNEAIASRAISEITAWRKENAWLFP
jgi:methylenetetrahydrofolate--tRNA-(uracil-5-)-methyltransferase